MTLPTPISIEEMRERIAGLSSIPSIPAILIPLLRLLEVPPECVEVQRVVELIGHDKSLAAQTLHMANSPLFGRWQNIQTIRGAVVALGMGRVREIATSCCILNLLPEKTATFDPRIFWEHSLGVAFVSRRMARKIGYCDPEHAYLAGLIHDIGLILNFLVLGDQFASVLREAANTGVPIGEVEAHSLGLDHALTGGLLAEHWALADDLKETIRRHHQPERAQGHHDLICIVNLSDTLCRIRGLGYGFSERLQAFQSVEPAWLRLVEKFPGLMKSDFAKLSSELDPYLGEVRNLVSVLFRMQ